MREDNEKKPESPDEPKSGSSIGGSDKPGETASDTPEDEGSGGAVDPSGNPIRTR